MKKIFLAVLCAVITFLSAFGAASCGQNKDGIFVCAPDGATALALAGLINGQSINDFKRRVHDNAYHRHAFRFIRYSHSSYYVIAEPRQKRVDFSAFFSVLNNNVYNCNTCFGHKNNPQNLRERRKSATQSRVFIPSPSENLFKFRYGHFNICSKKAQAIE